MKRLLVLLYTLITLTSFATLDLIDADGVTEKGGAPEYARMLPRTKSDGMIDASFLPPVADWGSTPIPGVSYVASQVTHAGNGSVQYPFKTIRAAVEAGSKTLVIIPGSYSETVPLESGAVLSLVGLGSLSFVSELKLTASGPVQVSLSGVSAERISANGGPVTLSLAGSRVSRLSVTSSEPSAVVLRDMGSTVLSISGGCSVCYSGRDTIAKAEALVGDGDQALSFSEDRLVVGDDTVAYLSDVSNATNGILSSTVLKLQEEDEILHGRIDDETDERVSSYESLSADVKASLSEMSTRIEKIGDGWNTRLDTLSANVVNIGDSLSALEVKETNDVDQLGKKIENETEKAEEDNDALETKLRGETNASILELRSDIPTIADERANVQIESARDNIISEAVSLADENADDLIEPVILRVDTLEGDVDTLQEENKEQGSDISALKADVKNAASAVSSLEKKEAADIKAVTSEIDNVRKAYVAADKALKTELEGDLLSLSNAVPGIADTCAARAVSNARNGIIDDAYSKSIKKAEDLIKPVTEQVSTLSTKVTSLQSTVSALEDTVSELDASVGDISDAQGTLTEKVEDYNKNAKADIKGLTDWKTETEKWKDSAEKRDNVRRDRINAILAILRALKDGASWSTIVIPGDIGSGE